MSTFLHTAETTSGRVSRKTTVRVARDEAVDVLHEMHRLAEERLVEACASYQDIAFEMEWRLVEWNRLQREQKQVEKLLSQKRRTSLQFNNRSHPRGSEVRNRTAAWQRQVATLVRRQRQHKDKMTRLADIIRARNTEGVELFNEIELLQSRALRIEQALKHMKTTARMSVRGSPEQMWPFNSRKPRGRLLQQCFRNRSVNGPQLGRSSSVAFENNGRPAGCLNDQSTWSNQHR